MSRGVEQLLFNGHIADASILRGAVAAAAFLVVGINVGIRDMRGSAA